MQQQGKDILSCADNPGSASCQRGQAVQNAVAVAMGAGLTGGVVAVATPEMLAAAQAGVSACVSNPILCVNEVTIWLAEMGMGDALPAGLAMGATGKITAEQLSILSEMKATMAIEKQTGSKVSADAVEQLVSGKGTTGAGSLGGQPTKYPPNAAAEEIRSLKRENESAVALSESGYHVEQNPVTPGVQNPDYKIDGEIYDNYAPKSSNVRNIWSEVKGKIDEGQTTNVVINLADSPVTLDVLKNQFSQWPIDGLDKVIVIDKSGSVIKFK